MSAGQHHSADKPEESAPASASTRLWLWMRDHLRVLVIAALALAAGMVLVLAPGRENEDHPTSAQESPTIAEPASPPHEHPGPGSDHAEDTPEDQRREVESVARGFATDFADPGKDKQDWFGRVSRWTNPHLSTQLELTDWGRIPSAEVMIVQPAATGMAVVDVVVGYDTGLRIGVRVERARDGWKVTTFHPMTTAY